MPPHTPSTIVLSLSTPIDADSNAPRGPLKRPSDRLSGVVFEPEMRDQVFAAHPAQRVLELHQLDENVLLGINVRRVHRGLEAVRQPFLYPAHAVPLRQIHKHT